MQRRQPKVCFANRSDKSTFTPSALDILDKVSGINLDPLAWGRALLTKQVLHLESMRVTFRKYMQRGSKWEQK